MNRILKSLQINNKTIANRLMLAPSETETGDSDGYVTDETLAWFEQRSRGFGLVVTEHTAVDTLGLYHPKMFTAANDGSIPGLQKLADLLHANNCACMVQLDHGGGWDLAQLRGCLNPEMNPTGLSPADDLSDGTLEKIAEDFGAAAYRVQKAGFDGVQIKGCHVFLLGMLFSPLTNHRTSGKYSGKDFEGRSRLYLEVLQSIRANVRKDFIISARMAVEDFCEGGSTVQDSIRLAQLLEKNGADILDLSGGVKHYYSNPYCNDPGYFGEDSYQIKKAVSIPVALTGGVQTLAQAERLLEEDKADIIGVCRAARNDMYWAQKELAGKQ